MTYRIANPLGKPVLDQEMFQQLLSAAYTLQVQNHPLPAKESVLAATESKVEPLASTTVSPLQPELESRANVPVLAPEVRLAASLKLLRQKPGKAGLRAVHPAPPAPTRSGHTTVRKRISPRNDWFWKAATVAAMAAVSALLFAAWIDRPSPLPPGLTLPEEVLQQRVPFQRAEPVATPQPQSAKGGRTIMMEPPAAPRAEPTVVDEPTEGATASGTAQKTTANLNRHSSYESDDDLVAPDTVVHYSPRSAASVQGKP